MAQTNPFYFATRDIFEHTGVPVDVFRVTHTDDMPLHAHEFAEIVIVTGGEAVHRMFEREQLLVVGDVFVVHPGSSHAYTQVDNLELTNILFVESLLDAWVDQDASPCGGLLERPSEANAHTFPRSVNLSPEQLVRVDAITREMEDELRLHRAGTSYLVVACLLRLVGELIRHCVEQHHESDHTDRQLGRAYRLVAERYAQRITLSDLTNVAGMSESSLTRAFKRSSGLTPIEYLIAYRVRQSCRLLQYTDDSVTKIAFDTGFSDSNYFSRKFHELMGLTPVQYRRQMRTRTQRVYVKDSSQWRVQYRKSSVRRLDPRSGPHQEQ